MRTAQSPTSSYPGLMPEPPTVCLRGTPLFTLLLRGCVAMTPPYSRSREVLGPGLSLSLRWCSPWWWSRWGRSPWRSLASRSRDLHINISWYCVQHIKHQKELSAYIFYFICPFWHSTVSYCQHNSYNDSFKYLHFLKWKYCSFQWSVSRKKIFCF